MLAKVKAKLPGARVTGLDISPVMLARCGSRGLTDVAVASGNALPYADAQFDSVLAATWVIRYLQVDVALWPRWRASPAPGAASCSTCRSCRGIGWSCSRGSSGSHRGCGCTTCATPTSPLDGRWVPAWRRSIEAAGLSVVDVVGGIDSPIRSERLSFRRPFRDPVGLALSTIVWFLAEKPL